MQRTSGILAGLIAAFGDQPLVFRWAAAAFSLASLVLVYLIVHNVSGQAPAAFAAIVFAMVSSDPGTGGEGANREIYMNLLILGSWYCALRWAGTNGPPIRERGIVADPSPDDAPAPAAGRLPNSSWLVFAGALLGLASSVKTIVAIQWFFLAAWATWVAAGSVAPGRRLRVAVKSWLALGIPPAALWTATLAYFWASGRAADFIDAVFLFNVGYSEGGDGFFQRFALFFRPPRHPFVFDSAFPVWVGAAIGAVVLLWRSVAGRSATAGLLLCLLISSYLAVCMPGRFWPHYYYLLIAPAVITVAHTTWTVSFAGNRLGHRPFASKPGFVVLCAALALLVFAAEYRYYLAQPPFGITVTRYNSRDFWGRAQGENVRRVTTPEDRVFVYGNEAEIYYYSDRRCASRYTMLTGLSEGMAGAEKRRGILMEELRASPPRLILLLFDQQPFEEWLGFLREHYGEPVAWDFHDRTGKPIMAVLARKDQPIQSLDWNWDRSAVGGWHLGAEPPQSR